MPISNEILLYHKHKTAVIQMMAEVFKTLREPPSIQIGKAEVVEADGFWYARFPINALMQISLQRLARLDGYLWRTNEIVIEPCKFTGDYYSLNMFTRRTSKDQKSIQGIW